ncbi:uncharacterized protein LOC144161944 [Haemaphysalis longicornis]
MVRQRLQGQKEAILMLSLPELTMLPRFYEDPEYSQGAEFFLSDVELKPMIGDILEDFQLNKSFAEHIYLTDAIIAKQYKDARNSQLQKQNLAGRGVQVVKIIEGESWDWALFLTPFFNKSITNETFVRYEYIQYFQTFEETIGVLLQSNPLATAHFLALRMLLWLTPAFTTSDGEPSSLSDFHFRFQRGLKKAPRRFRTCLFALDRFATHILTHAFEKLVDRDHNAPQLQNIFRAFIRQNLTTAADKVFSFSSHTNSRSRLLSFRKTKKIKTFVFQPYQRMLPVLKNIYEGVEKVKSGSFLDDLVAHAEAENRYYWNHVHGFNDSGGQIFVHTPRLLHPEASYAYDTNRLIIPFSILYNYDISDLELNVFRKVKIAFNIMRAIVKLYDPIGSVVNEKAFFENWVSGYALLKTNELESCIKRVYRREKRPPIMALENFADFIGMSATIRYFRETVRRMAYPRSDYRLQDFKLLSSEQLLFYAIGEEFCQRWAPGAKKEYQQSDFAENRARLTHILNSMELFHETFRCYSRAQCKVLVSDYPEDDTLQASLSIFSIF